MARELKTFELMQWLQNELSDENLNIELLNKKDDLVKTFDKTKIFIQYIGLDYTNPKGGAGVVKFAIYVVGRTLFNNNNNIVRVLDTIRNKVIRLPYDNENMADIPAYLNGKIEIKEDKFNNTETLEFIYSLVIGIPVIA
jgi:hypothetical protein